jgi:Cu/Ag efflux protein CusF
MMRVTRMLVAILALSVLFGFVAQVMADETKGKIKSVAAAKDELVLTDSGNKDHTFRVADKAKIIINDKEGKLADLKTGDEVTVTYQRQANVMLASEIRCSRKK